MLIIENILWTTWVCLIAAILYTYNFKKLSSLEKWILAFLWINVAADLGSNIALSNGVDLSGSIYNPVALLQRSIVLFVYYKYCSSVNIKQLNLIGLLALWLIHLIGWALHKGVGEFHRDIYIYSGLITAFLSYWTLKDIILKRDELSTIIVGFCIGNFVYLTLMVSSQSALELAYIINKQFGELVYLGNDIGYALHSIILIIAALWKKKL